MNRALLVVFLTLAQVSVAAAPRSRAVRPITPTAPPAIVAAAHQAADAAMKAGVPAVQIAVSSGGKIIYSEAFGITDKQTATAATPQYVQQIASLTKQFTAAGILRLAERGQLTLDDRIEKFVPEFNPRGATITLRRLLSHTAGLPREWFPPTAPVSLIAPTTRAQTIQYLNGQPFLFAPGKSWSYSNAAYMLLGYAIESITGQSYADFIRDEFALPLGLLNTGLCGTSHLPVPKGYGITNGTSSPQLPLHNTVVLSAGGLCSTATDLARWSHLLATGYAMLPASYETMTTKARLDNNTFAPGGYALGVGVQTVLGQPAVLHGGDIWGFQSFLLYFSDQDVAVAVITNSFPAPAGSEAQTIALTVAYAALTAQQ